MNLTDLFHKKLQETDKYEFEDTEIKFPIIICDETERTETNTLAYCGRHDVLQEDDRFVPVGNTYGAHGEKARNEIPNDYDWYARTRGVQTYDAGTYMYGYFNDTEVLIRQEPVMAHQTANYYWVHEADITISKKN